MTRVLMALGVATFAFACADTDDTLSPVEVQTEQTRLDLNEEDQVYVVNGPRVGDETPEFTVVRRSGDVEPFGQWAARVQAHAGVDLTDGDNPFRAIVITNPDGRLTPEEVEDRYLVAVPEANSEQACPPACFHCPEDYGYLCYALCTGR